MAPHSSTLAWKIPWTEEPGRLQSMGSQRVGQDWVTSLSLHFSLSCIREGNGNPLQCSCLENPRDGGAWWAAVYGVTQSQAWLKWVSSRSSSRVSSLIVLALVVSAPNPKAQGLISGQEQRFHKWFVMALSEIKTNIQKHKKTKMTQDKSDQISRSVMSDSLRSHESQHTRPPCPSPIPGVHWDSRP